MPGALPCSRACLMLARCPSQPSSTSRCALRCTAQAQSQLCCAQHAPGPTTRLLWVPLCRVHAVGVLGKGAQAAGGVEVPQLDAVVPGAAEEAVAADLRGRGRRTADGGAGGAGGAALRCCACGAGGSLAPAPNPSLTWFQCRLYTSCVCSWKLRSGLAAGGAATSHTCRHGEGGLAWQSLSRMPTQQQWQDIVQLDGASTDSERPGLALMPRPQQPAAACPRPAP